MPRRRRWLWRLNRESRPASRSCEVRFMRQVAMRCWSRTARRPADRWGPRRPATRRTARVAPNADAAIESTSESTGSPAVRAGFRQQQSRGSTATSGRPPPRALRRSRRDAAAWRPLRSLKEPVRCRCSSLSAVHLGAQNRGVVLGRRFCGSCRQSARTLDPASKIISRAGSGVSEPVLVAPAQHGPEPRRQDRRGARQVTVERTRRPGEHTRSPGFLFP